MTSLTNTLDSYTPQGIFKDLSMLREDYIPELIHYRSDLMKVLAQKVYAPPLARRPSSHIFVYGSSGTAKTLINKYWMHELHKESEKKEINARCFYLNCSELTNQTEAAQELYSQVSENVPRRMGLKYYTDHFFEIIDKKYKFVIIILDEAEKILKKKDEDRLFYILLRNRELEKCKNVWVTLVVISNRMNLKELLCEGTQSSFGINWLFFPRYTSRQLFNILEDRTKLAFNESVISSDIVHQIAEYTNQLGGDARLAISYLKETGLIAEEKKAKKVGVEDFEEAKRILEEKAIMQELANLSKSEKLVYFSVAVAVTYNKKHTNQQKADVPLIYDIYIQLSKKMRLDNLSERHIRNHLEKIKNTDLIMKMLEKGKYYYAPIYSLDLILKTMELFEKKHNVKLKEVFGEIMKYDQDKQLIGDIQDS